MLLVFILCNGMQYTVSDWIGLVWITSDGRLKDEKEEKDQSRGSHEGGLHPSLYPILLLLSKMRPAAEESPHTVVTDAGVASRQADISLFVPLVQSCRGQQSQKVK